MRRLNNKQRCAIRRFADEVDINMVQLLADDDELSDEERLDYIRDAQRAIVLLKVGRLTGRLAA